MSPADGFVPYAPLDTLKTVTRDIWIVDGHEVRMHYLGFAVPFPTRSTIVRLPGETLWVHSPVAADAALYDAVAALGPVAHLVAPNTLHHSWIGDWHRRFPDATVHRAPGLRAAGVPPGPTLGDAPDPAWAGVIDQRVATGRLLNEVVFHHRPSATVILTDLIENFEPDRVRSRFWRWMMRLSGAADPDGKAPFDMQLRFLGHRRHLRRIVADMIAWAPERVIIAHGRWYDRDGTAELRRAFRWVG